MDGTIVDNMAFHTKSWLAFFPAPRPRARCGCLLPRHGGRQGHEIMSAYFGER
jgi:beta-phosphoglucomutase-like phosphatase (HAD superfamily)